MKIPTPPSPLILALLSLLPYCLSSTLLDNGPGNTLCLSLSAIDLTHAAASTHPSSNDPLDHLLTTTSDLTINLGLGLCLCIYEGVLTVPAEAALEAAITGNVVAEVTDVLGLGAIGLSDADVEEGIKAAVLVLVLLQEGRPSRSCSYPAFGIPDDCVTCHYNCASGYHKCQNTCIPSAQPCPSSNAASKRNTGLLTNNVVDRIRLTSNGYLRARAVGADAYTYGQGTVYGKGDLATHSYGTGYEYEHGYASNLDAKAKADLAANANAKANANPNANAKTNTHVHHIRSNTYNPNNALSVDANAKASANADIQAQLLELGISCQSGYTPCGLGGDYKRGDKRGVDQGWECVDVLNDLECCGGCLHPILGDVIGIDCSGIQGVNSVACVKGQCKISTCQHGWRYDSLLNICNKIDLSSDLSGDYKHIL